MNKIIILIASFCVMGCASLKKKPSVPPSVSTVQVIQSLNDTKSELNEAGIANSKVAANIDKALTLAEKLETLLAQIEKEQAILANKNIIKPIK